MCHDHKFSKVPTCRCGPESKPRGRGGGGGGEGEQLLWPPEGGGGRIENRRLCCLREWRKDCPLTLRGKQVYAYPEILFWNGLVASTKKETPALTWSQKRGKSSLNTFFPKWEFNVHRFPFPHQKIYVSDRPFPLEGVSFAAGTILASHGRKNEKIGNVGSAAVRMWLKRELKIQQRGKGRFSLVFPWKIACVCIEAGSSVFPPFHFLTRRRKLGKAAVVGCGKKYHCKPSAHPHISRTILEIKGPIKKGTTQYYSRK